MHGSKNKQTKSVHTYLKKYLAEIAEGIALEIISLYTYLTYLPGIAVKRHICIWKTNKHMSKFYLLYEFQVDGTTIQVWFTSRVFSACSWSAAAFLQEKQATSEHRTTLCLWQLWTCRLWYQLRTLTSHPLHLRMSLAWCWTTATCQLALGSFPRMLWFTLQVLLSGRSWGSFLVMYATERNSRLMCCCRSGATLSRGTKSTTKTWQWQI